MDLTFSPLAFQTRVRMGRGSWRLAPLELVMLGGALAVILWLATTLQRNLPPWPLTLVHDPWRLWLYLALAVPLSIYVTVAVHEVGHLLVALALGYHFVLIHVGMVGLGRTASGLRWRRTSNNLLALRGGTIVLPQAACHSRWCELAVVAGGPLLQILWLVGLHWINGAVQTEVIHPYLVALLHSLTYLTFIGLCSCIIPFRFGMTATDARHVFQLLRGGAAVERQLAVQQLTARVFRDTSYAELDAAAIAAVITPTDGSRSSYAAQLLAAARALSRGEATAAAAALNQVLAFVHANPALRQAGWPFFYAARYELAFGRGPQAARPWLACAAVVENPLLAVDLSQAWLHLEARLLQAEGRLAAARTAAQQSLALVEQRLDWGGTQEERQGLHALLAQLPAGTPAAVWRPASPGWRPLRTLLNSGASLVGLIVLCAFF
ncbi:MAG: hypothetical protein R3C14_24700 [Caldilineaceae bacterium]